MHVQTRCNTVLMDGRFAEERRMIGGRVAGGRRLAHVAPAVL